MANSVNGIFITSDGCSIAYTLHPSPAADAPRIALIHSLALDRSFWNGVVAELGDCAEVLTYDCRGHGQSTRKAATYTPFLFARDLAELLAHVRWPAAHVAGCSMGGCVAQAFGADYAQHAASVCLIDTTAWYGTAAPEQWRDRAATACSKGLAALVDFQNTRWLSEQFRKAHPEILDALTKVFLANNIDCYRSACEMLGDADLRAQAVRIKVPASIVVGSEDYATPVTMAEWLHRAIPQSSMTVIPGCKHLSPVECPKVISSQIMKLAQPM